MDPDEVEPWLRGPLAGVHPLVADLARLCAGSRGSRHWTNGLSDAKSGRGRTASRRWDSTAAYRGQRGRLTTYLRGEQLTPEQLAQSLARWIRAGTATLLAEVNELCTNPNK
jgi:hypothetical protein